MESVIEIYKRILSTEVEKLRNNGLSSDEQIEEELIKRSYQQPLQDANPEDKTHPKQNLQLKPWKGLNS